MPPEAAVLDPVAPADDALTLELEALLLREPAPARAGIVAGRSRPDDEQPADEQASRAHPLYVRGSLVDRPWAVRQTMLAKMIGAEGMSIDLAAMREEITSQRETVAASNFERIGGQMMASAAVIPVHGVITQRYDFWSWFFGGTSIDLLRNALREVIADPAVGAVIFDIDSPGGSVDGLTEFAKELRTLRGGAKPIVSVVEPLAASAAYWIGCQVDELVVTPSGEVGSIGVYAAHEDDSALLEKMGVKITLISAGAYKTEGNPFEPLGDEAEAAIQEQVDTFYAMFLSDVALGRDINVNAVASGYGEGRTMLAKKALQAGMVDRIDTLENTALRLARSAKPGRRSAIEEALPRGQLPDPQLAAVDAASVGRPDRAWNARIAKRRRTR